MYAQIQEALESRYAGLQAVRLWKDDRGENPNRMSLASAALNLAQRAAAKAKLTADEAAEQLLAGRTLETPLARFQLVRRSA